jgi:hypothetical protein
VRRGARAAAALVAACVVLGAAAHAQEPDAPRTVAAFALEDQHGELRRIDESARGILLSRDMTGGDFVKTALAEDGLHRLETAGVRYVADVSRMPSLIRKTFAEPAMRKRPYPILLDRDGAATKDLPRADERAVLVVLDRLAVVRVDELDSAGAVRAALDALAPRP